MKTALTILIILVIAAAAPVAAQNDYLPFERPFIAVAGGGLTVPTSDFSDVLQTGLHLYLGGGVPATDYAAFIAKLEYMENAYDPEIGIARDDGSDFLALMFGLDLILTPPTPSTVQPFLIVGGGFSSVTLEKLETADLFIGEAEETKLYFNVGAGLAVQQFGPVSLFVAARYVIQQMPEQPVTNPEGNSYKAIPITVGIQF